MPPAHPASPGPVRNNPRRHFSGPGCSSLAKGEWLVPHRTSPCLFAEPWEPVELSEQFLLRGHSWPGCLWPLPWAPGSSWWKPRHLASAPPCPCAGRAWVGSSRDEKVRSCLCLPLSVGSHLWGPLPGGCIVDPLPPALHAETTQRPLRLTNLCFRCLCFASLVLHHPNHPLIAPLRDFNFPLLGALPSPATQLWHGAEVGRLSLN